jgi:hypothetical protein
MTYDVKMRRVISKYGLRGYGLYNFILESITAHIEDDRPLPILEEASTDIAELFNEDTAKIEEMLWYFIAQGLIEQEEIEGKIMCTKVYRYLQQSETRSKKIRALIQNYKNVNIKSPELLSQTVTDNCEEKTRLDKTIREKKGPEKISHPTLSLPLGKSRWERIVSEYGLKVCDAYLDKIVCWEDAKKGGKRQYRDYAAACEDWLKRDKVSKVMQEDEGMIDVSRLGK